jgi:hypothetical protein
MFMAHLTLKRLVVGAALAASVLLSGCTLFGFLDSIDVQVNGATASTVDFGSVMLTTSSAPMTISIVNKGLFPLTFGGASAITVGGNAGSDFVVSGISGDTIQPGGSVTFTLTFSPTAAGSRNASVTIKPEGGGGSSSFAASGTGSSSGQIAVADGQGAPISDGGNYPGGIVYAVSGHGYFFTITNIDVSNDLTLSTTPVTVNSSDGSFTVYSQPASPVTLDGGQSSFELMFTTAVGDYAQKTATVTIGNSATGTFTFTITAQGNAG